MDNLRQNFDLFCYAVQYFIAFFVFIAFLLRQAYFGYEQNQDYYDTKNVKTKIIRVPEKLAEV